MLLDLHPNVYLFSRLVLSDDEILTTEMNAHGLAVTPTSKLFGQVKSDLLEHARKHPLIDLSKNKNVAREVGDDNSSDSSSSSGSSDSSGSEEETEEELMADAVLFDAEGKLLTSPGPVRMAPEEWQILMQKYAKPATNTLEREREAYFTTRHSGKTMHASDCRSEADLIMFQRQR